MYNVEQLRRELEKALEIIRMKFDMDVTIGTIRYDDTSFRVSIKGLEHGALTLEAKQYNHVQRKLFIDDKGSFQLPTRGSVIKGYDDVVLQLTGWSHRSKKKPIIARDMDGQEWMLTMAYVKRAKVLQVADPDTE
jgi:hypothetical protein